MPRVREEVSGRSSRLDFANFRIEKYIFVRDAAGNSLVIIVYDVLNMFSGAKNQEL